MSIKTDRSQISDTSDVFDVNHIGGYTVGDIVIYDNIINICQITQPQGSVHTPTNTESDTYWKMSSLFDILNSSMIIPITNGEIHIFRKVVNVNISTATSGQGTSQGVQLGTMPERYRPNKMILQSAFNSKDIWLQINTTGEILIVGTGQFRGSTTYIV